MSLTKKIIGAMVLAITFQTSNYQPYTARLCIHQTNLDESAQLLVEKSKDITQDWFRNQNLPVKLATTNCDVHVHYLSTRDFYKAIMGEDVHEQQPLTAASSFGESTEMSKQVQSETKRFIQYLQKKQSPFSIGPVQITDTKSKEKNINEFRNGVEAVQITTLGKKYSVYVDLQKRLSFKYFRKNQYEEAVVNYLSRNTIHETLHAMGLIHPYSTLLRNSYRNQVETNCRLNNIMGKRNTLIDFFQPTPSSPYGKKLSTPQKTHLQNVLTRGTVENKSFREKQNLLATPHVMKWRSFTAKQYECAGLN